MQVLMKNNQEKQKKYTWCYRINIKALRWIKSSYGASDPYDNNSY